MTIGCTISGYTDLNVEFNAAAPPGVTCGRCGGQIDMSYAPAQLALKKFRRLDIAYTTDLKTVFSRRALDVLGESLRDCFVKPIDRDEQCFYVMPKRIVPFDTERRGVRFGAICAGCGRPIEAARFEPVFLRLEQLPGAGLFRTDVEFAYGSNRHPLIIADPALCEALRSARLRGLALLPAYGQQEEAVTRTGWRFPPGVPGGIPPSTKVN
jgi:hypothetical protein